MITGPRRNAGRRAGGSASCPRLRRTPSGETESGRSGEGVSGGKLGGAAEVGRIEERVSKGTPWGEAKDGRTEEGVPRRVRISGASAVAKAVLV